MWSVRKKLNLKVQDVPTALFDESGNLVTRKDALLSLFEKEYKNRLGPKQPWKGYEQMHFLHEQLFKWRMIDSFHNKSEPWKYEDLVKS